MIQNQNWNHDLWGIRCYIPSSHELVVHQLHSTLVGNKVLIDPYIITPLPVHSESSSSTSSLGIELYLLHDLF